ncbi:MAG: 50S ribosomal protein L21 [Firmicutes bacterium ADurb.Bin080]|jgi:large subunit ribosomal protein L21|nr:50S ribosomal protein L21 [Clostridiales bacterium]OQC16032.1 MAG: 50S ribosomal protein L21 [Firmicutes bacterium ADurb.Bin080]
MYAIVETGGKQYKVSTGDTLKVELLSVNLGEIIKLPLLLVSNEGKIMTGDSLSGKYAEAEVVFHGKARKIDIFTYKAKKNVRRRKGHRQPYTEIKINNIVL